ncbi:MAG: mechanosensitive ion channel [Gemmatimonadota bacterium]|nr:mechanosensitive ion channel [Gemmatimonadota bacterium]
MAATVGAVSLCAVVGTLSAQDTTSNGVVRPSITTTSPDLSISQTKVDVNPVARDEEIRRRLQSVLEATGWFVSPHVRVQSGVVFLEGTASTEQLRTWAGDLARNTQDVVAVVNRITVPGPSMWDFRPASRGVMVLWRDMIGALPSIAFGAIVLVVSLIAAVAAARGTRRVLLHRVRVKLLRTVAARAAGVLILLLGIYVILRVMGLTQLALTIVGGTGLIGLAVGIAFRDITENFLASIFLSIQRPFEPADLIEVAGVTGYVQQLNMRTTVLMNLDGNVVQIPNATVYKSNLRNYTTNCNRRESFEIGIGYDDAIADSQEIARRVLDAHPAVLQDPEPSVLVDSLGQSTVNLRVYFWIDGSKNSWLKVRSSVIRLVKREFQQHGISMPDAAREIIFPQGIPIVHDDPEETAPAASPREAPGSDVVSTKAEGGLHSEAGVIEEQARKARKPGEHDLLEPGALSTDAEQEATSVGQDRQTHD